MVNWLSNIIPKVSSNFSLPPGSLSLPSCSQDPFQGKVWNGRILRVKAYDQDYLCPFKEAFIDHLPQSPTSREEGPETEVNDLVNDMHLDA